MLNNVKNVVKFGFLTDLCRITKVNKQVKIKIEIEM